jgi:hypothetical protein
LSDSSQDRDAHFKKKRYFRTALVLALILLLNIAGTWFGHLVNIQVFPRHESMLNVIIFGAVAIYILLMAIPFMPGIEIGLAVMALLGGKSALLIYMSTLIALSISYMIGKYFPLHLVHKLLKWLYLNKASELIGLLEPLDPPQRLKFLYGRSPTKFAPYLLKHRYAAIAFALNLPGNALIGGGGGIGLIVGMSRLIPFHKYILVVSAAIAPVPLFLYFQGT